METRSFLRLLVVAVAVLAFQGFPPVMAQVDCDPAAYASQVGPYTGFAAVFDGQPHHRVVVNQAIPIPRHQFTIEVFFKVTRFSNLQRILSCRSPDGTGGWALSLSGTNPRFERFSGAVVSAPAAIQAGRWYRLVVVTEFFIASETSGARIYLGDAGQSSIPIVGAGNLGNLNSATSSPPSIGADPDGTNPFSGQIAEVRLFGSPMSVPATPGVWQSLAPVANALVFAYQFREGAGNSTTDLGNFNQDGTLIGVGWSSVGHDSDGNGVLDYCQAPCAGGSQPASMTVCPGGSFQPSFQPGCLASGGVVLQWFRNGVAIPGAIDHTLLVFNAGQSDVGTYFCRAFNASNPSLFFDSDRVQLTLATPPVEPDSAAVTPDEICLGAGTVTLAVQGWSHLPGDSVVWRSATCGGTVVGTGSPLVIPSPATSTAYYAQVVNGCFTSECVSAGTVHVERSPRSIEVLTAMSPLSAGIPAGSFRDVATGFNWAAAIRTDGTLVSWDASGSGLGPAPAGRYASVHGGHATAYAIRNDGTAVGWGANAFGEALVPAGRYRTISGGIFWAAGLRVDGAIVAWGGDASGRGLLSPPSGQFIDVAVFGDSGVGVRVDGSLALWGFVQPGTDAIPTGTFLRACVGTDFVCALRTDGTLAVWGSLLPELMARAPLPQGRFVDIDAGTGHIALTRETGELVVWGICGFPDCGPAPSGTYRAFDAGEFATIAIAEYPVIRQPRDASVPAGASVLLDFQINLSTPVLSPFTWTRNGEVFARQASGPLLIPAMTPDLIGTFACSVNTLCGPVDSRAAVLTVACAVDFNRDGDVNPDDLSDFVTCFFQQVSRPGDCVTADFNADGSVNPDDLSDYITVFFAGC